MQTITWAQWKQWHDEGSYTLLPYIRRIAAPPHADDWMPAAWDRFWQDASSYACVLESGKDGRYTMVGAQPVEVMRGKGSRAKIYSLSEGDVGEVSATDLSEGDIGKASAKSRPNISPETGEQYHASGRSAENSPLESVRAWLREWTAPRPAGFPDCCSGGIVGYWSYDVARSLEKLPEWSQDDLRLPEFLFQRYEQLWIVDHQEREVYAAVHVKVAERHYEIGGSPLSSVNRRLSDSELWQLYREAEAAADGMERQWRHWCKAAEAPDVRQRLSRIRDLIERDSLQIDVEGIPGLSTSMSKGQFQQAVRRIQDYIAQGDVFQVNLSLRQSLPVDATPERLYEWLRHVNPSPYMGMLRTPDFALVSASPELLVKLDGGKLRARPIAGTRRRGRTAEDDREMEEELRSSEKERAEHVMLVDLERNDLGRVAAYGTVKVPELLTVERYSHVMHLVSQVEARLAPGKDALDVVAAMFPGGTITGAPKIRTMEIIEEMEPVRRGPYTGSMGWIDYAGNMEFNIIIRTMVCKDGNCHIQAGAGIVIDSDPEREFHECLNKAKALWKTVQYTQAEASQGQGRG